MGNQSQTSAKIELNRQLHNKIADRYHLIHGDIFNSHEQARISKQLKKIRDSFSVEPPLALDYGCGSGNMTAQLRALGFNVVSADISDRFVDLLAQRYKTDSGVIPCLLSGDPQRDLQQYEFSAICIYSVLHHIPDYLSVLKDLMGLIGLNGFLYIDHEASDAFWNDDEKYAELQRRTRWSGWQDKWPLLFKWSWYATKYRMLRDPRYQPEGDLHVWKDDHIEWNRIRTLAVEQGFREIHSEDYLNFRPHYSADLFRIYSGLTSDMHCSIFQRNDRP